MGKTLFLLCKGPVLLVTHDHRILFIYMYIAYVAVSLLACFARKKESFASLAHCVACVGSTGPWHCGQGEIDTCFCKYQGAGGSYLLPFKHTG